MGDRLMSRKRKAEPPSPALKSRLVELGFRQITDWAWQRRVNGVVLNFWPSRAKYQFGGVVARGDIDKVEEVLAHPEDVIVEAIKRRTESDVSIVIVGSECPWNPTPGKFRTFIDGELVSALTIEEILPPPSTEFDL